MSKLLSLALAAVAAFAMVSTSTPVFAGEPATQSIAVTYGDLNLATAEGIKALKGRVRDAAREVCGPAIVGQNYRESFACQSAAMADAAPQVARVIDGHRPQVILASRR